MGLTIHYTLTTTLTRVADVRRAVGAMRQTALDLPFAAVGEVREWSGDAGPEVAATEGERWLLTQAAAYLPDGDGHREVRPRHVVAFPVDPGKGCEPANLGLCRYPLSVPVERRGRTCRLRTGLAGWRWSSFCKTQYASHPDCGGIENFLRCHLGLVKLFDLIRAGGVVNVEVEDEGEYHAKRDIAALAKTVVEWNEMVAGLVGAIRSQAEGRGVPVAAPILRFPAFEHLEARGAGRWADLRRRLGPDG